MTTRYFRSICLASVLISGMCYADNCVVPPNLTQVSTIRSVGDGVAKLLALATWAESQNHGCPSQDELQATYASAQNSIFVRTHIVRLQSVVENTPPTSAGSTWSNESREAVLENHQHSIGVFERLEQNLTALRLSSRGVLISDRIWNGQSIGNSFFQIEGLPRVNRKSSGSMMGFPSLRQDETLVFNVGSLVRALRSRPAVTPFSASQTSDSAIRQLHSHLNLQAAIPRQFDLSSRFDRPESQILQNGVKTFACAGFALSSALEFLFDQFPRVPLTPRFEVSPWHTYALMQTAFSPATN